MWQEGYKNKVKWVKIIPYIVTSILHWSSIVCIHIWYFLVFWRFSILMKCLSVILSSKQIVLVFSSVFLGIFVQSQSSCGAIDLYSSLLIRSVVDDRYSMTHPFPKWVKTETLWIWVLHLQFVESFITPVRIKNVHKTNFRGI